MQRDELYLDAELTVERVSKYLGMAPKLILATMNQHLGKNFNAFINEYQVAAGLASNLNRFYHINLPYPHACGLVPMQRLGLSR